MKVLVMRAGHIGPDYYRVEEPVRAVEEAGLGFDITITKGLTTSMTTPRDGSEPEVQWVDAKGASVVVLQLPKTLGMLQCIRVLQSQGVAVVVEMDDLLNAVPYGHAGHGALVRRGMARLAMECAREADLVTASTPGLVAEYAPHSRGVVVPNAVPRRLAELPPAYERTSDVVTVGWTGNVLGHPYDLQVMESGLQQALDRTRGRSRFVILGQKWDAQQRLRLVEDPIEIPWVHDVDQYLELMGNGFDVGIAPLRLDKFNNSKSWLKPMEYAARGVLCVHSPTSEYLRLGLGRHAKAPRDWARWLTQSIENDDERRELAAANHQRVLAAHLTEHTAERWAGAWRAALDNRVRSQRIGA